MTAAAALRWSCHTSAGAAANTVSISPRRARCAASAWIDPCAILSWSDCSVRTSSNGWAPETGGDLRLPAVAVRGPGPTRDADGFRLRRGRLQIRRWRGEVVGGVAEEIVCLRRRVHFRRRRYRGRATHGGCRRLTRAGTGATASTRRGAPLVTRLRDRACHHRVDLGCLTRGDFGRVRAVGRAQMGQRHPCQLAGRRGWLVLPAGRARWRRARC